ncbi:hypothetical protein BDZ91DRAFT_782915 [Kalaharituber pfeilii]|nr:hypothetical protein BDZ91DRAFT_782915 [Kalaharituber pfeilii]
MMCNIVPALGLCVLRSSLTAVCGMRTVRITSIGTLEKKNRMPWKERQYENMKRGRGEGGRKAMKRNNVEWNWIMSVGRGCRNPYPPTPVKKYTELRINVLLLLLQKKKKKEALALEDGPPECGGKWGVQGTSCAGWKGEVWWGYWERKIGKLESGGRWDMEYENGPVVPKYFRCRAQMGHETSID